MRSAAQSVGDADLGPRPLPDEPLHIVDSLDFRFIRQDHCSSDVIREICTFVDTQNTSHPFQLPQWEGKGACFALLRRSGKLRWFALCGVFFPAGRYLSPIKGLTINRGPVCDDLDILQEGIDRLVEHARNNGFACIDIAPEWEGDFAANAAGMLLANGWLARPAARISLRLDLRPDPEKLLSGFRKATRYEIRRSEREGVEVSMADVDSADDCESWLRLYLNMAMEKRFEADQAVYVRQVLSWLRGDTERGGLFLSHQNGKLLGGILVVRCGMRCWYLLGATVKNCKPSAGHLLQWRAIQWARERGCVEYDFSGYQEAASNGPAFFKGGFGGNVVHFLPSQRYVLSPWRIRVCNLMTRLRSRLLSR